MQIAKSLLLSLALLAPMTSYASSGHDPMSAKIIKAHQEFVRNYAAEKKQTPPGIIKYQYGMKLDIEKVVRVSSASTACGVNPQLMTYEDSAGTLKTVKYQALNECRNKN
ncbi:hypothetical protein AUC61_17015 [Pseudomonas sp. S25]|uniref:DUF2790 domain-containing protein n=1 Tax=Pseudomonas maioricensis TaxID=1766623 RepID=A0ABS9ZKX6_9PSED|nr:DUF2790 domain-containing protein [Pseudomonas sp. S25]MCI8211230.1 hypothetical protein [Pseudomonas sp. S25]